MVKNTKVQVKAESTVETSSTAVETTHPDQVTSVVDDVDSISQRFESLNEKINFLAASIKEVQTVLKTLQKDYVKTVKTFTKKGRKNAQSKRLPSGFAKPTRLSDELSDFLKVPYGTEKARTDVTKMINEYIKEHQLQDVKDKRTIIPNADLRKIMNLPEGQTLTYFNLQTHIKHHFVK